MLIDVTASARARCSDSIGALLCYVHKLQQNMAFAHTHYQACQVSVCVASRKHLPLNVCFVPGGQYGLRGLARVTSSQTMLHSSSRSFSLH